MLKKYDLSNIPVSMTLLVEIIYPENKIIVNYNSEELVVLAVFDSITDKEIIPDVARNITRYTGMPFTNEFKYTIEEMIELQKTLPKEKEGFVVRYDNGLRVKIKGDEYMRIAKIIAHLSPIAFWDCMKNGVVQNEYLEQIPEEFKGQYENMIQTLEHQYKVVMLEVAKDIEKLPTTNNDKDSRKTIGLFLKENKLLK